MAKNSNFASPSNSKESVEVVLTPMDGKIQYRLGSKVFNNTTQEYVSSTKIMDAEDETWNLVFGGKRATKRFMKGKKKVKKIVLLSALGLEDCEAKG